MGNRCKQTHKELLKGDQDKYSERAGRRSVIALRRVSLFLTHRDVPL
jgi:hypothetical protein